MSDRITTEQLRTPHDPPPLGAAEDGTPVAEFAWSDDVVGIGYLPEEVGLVSGWTWPNDSASAGGGR